MQEEKNKLYTSTLVFFWITFAFFIIMTAGMYLPAVSFTLPYAGYILGLPSRAALSIVGLVLIILAAKAGITKISKAFFILAGAGALGMGISIILHNLVYGLLIKIFGESVWGNGGDEPVFFILAVIVCPLAILVGSIGSIVLIAKKKVKLN